MQCLQLPQAPAAMPSPPRWTVSFNKKQLRVRINSFFLKAFLTGIVSQQCDECLTPHPFKLTVDSQGLIINHPHFPGCSSWDPVPNLGRSRTLAWLCRWQASLRKLHAAEHNWGEVRIHIPADESAGKRRSSRGAESHHSTIL